MLRLLERIITEKTPYRIVTTNNSLEAPALLEQDEFDLIITDLKMPGLDGLDILRLVKEKNRSEEVIVITAFGSLDSAGEALSCGVFDYITKPFKKEQIIASVDRAMRWQRRKRQTLAMAALLEREPFADARRDFEREYVRLLEERCGGDPEAMARRSGLAPDRIRALMDGATAADP